MLWPCRGPAGRPGRRRRRCAAAWTASAGSRSASARAGGPPRRTEVRWLIDGMNVIGTRPDGWWRDRDAAMLRLVDMLERWAAAEGENVAVVFERRPSPPIRSTVVDVLHAPKPKANAADDEIVRLLRAEPDPAAVRVVTSDRWLADQASAAGASVEGSESFRKRLDGV